MNKSIKVIISLIIIAIIIGGGIFIYLKYEKPIKSNINLYANLNIYALDYDLNDVSIRKNIETNYKIAMNSKDNIIKIGKTLKNSGIVEKVLVNNSYYIFNENNENQSYYEDIIEIIPLNNESYRIELKLKKQKPLKIEQEGIFIVDDIIKLNISSDNWKGFGYCYKYSSKIIRVMNSYGYLINLNNSYYTLSYFFTLSENPINGYYKCFQSNINLNESNQFQLKIEYDYFGKLSNKDYIEFIFFDELYEDSTINNTLIYNINNI